MPVVAIVQALAQDRGLSPGDRLWVEGGCTPEKGEVESHWPHSALQGLSQNFKEMAQVGWGTSFQVLLSDASPSGVSRAAGTVVALCWGESGGEVDRDPGGLPTSWDKAAGRCREELGATGQEEMETQGATPGPGGWTAGAQHKHWAPPLKTQEMTQGCAAPSPTTGCICTGAGRTAQNH